MARVGLAPEMIGRLSVIAAAVCIPLLVNGLVVNGPAQRAQVVKAMPDKIAGNPYGTISPSVTFAHRDPISNPSEMTQIVRPKVKGTSSVSPKMMIGCDALGGVSSKLAHVAGKCLT